jgi:predicted metal-dependent hydrolase
MAPPLSAQLELPFAPVALNPVVSSSTALNGEIVEYVLHRSRGRRRISLSVDERGLRVGAPLRASLRDIESALQHHAQWVLRKLQWWREQRAPARRWESGETLFHLGTPLRLELVTGARDVSAVPGLLRIAAPDLSPASVAGLARHWLRAQALDHFHQRIDHFRQPLAVEVAAIRLSNARSRWGSCHASGRVSLNWRLIHMPQRLIDYVVAHELAHLREMNHSPRFWAVVASVIPDFIARRREMRREAHRYLME